MKDVLTNFWDRYRRAIIATGSVVGIVLGGVLIGKSITSIKAGAAEAAKAMEARMAEVGVSYDTINYILDGE